MRRHSLGLAFFAAAVTIAACSATETLAPGPSTSQRGGSSGHQDDTAVVSGPVPPPAPLPVVASFNLSGSVVGHEPGTDTTIVVGVANATITLVKVGAVNGDTLQPSVTTATTTTDGQGAFRIEHLAPAYYRIDITTPAGSPYANGTSGIGPARETEVKLYIALARQP
jgi:hypothetical protein